MREIKKWEKIRQSLADMVERNYAGSGIRLSGVE